MTLKNPKRTTFDSVFRKKNNLFQFKLNQVHTYINQVGLSSILLVAYSGKK